MITDIKESTFTADTRRREGEIVVAMTGNADTIVYERLKALLDQVQLKVTAQPIDEVVFDIQGLYFMNSSCLSLFLRFINVVVEKRAAKKCTVRFRSNPNLRWQRKSLQAIASYAPEFVVIQ